MSDSQNQNLITNTLEIRVCDEICIYERLLGFGLKVLKRVKNIIQKIEFLNINYQVMRFIFANLNNHSSPPIKSCGDCLILKL